MYNNALLHILIFSRIFSTSFLTPLSSSYNHKFLPHPFIFLLLINFFVQILFVDNSPVNYYYSHLPNTFWIWMSYVCDDSRLSPLSYCWVSHPRDPLQLFSFVLSNVGPWLGSFDSFQRYPHQSHALPISISFSLLSCVISLSKFAKSKDSINDFHLLLVIYP